MAHKTLALARSLPAFRPVMPVNASVSSKSSNLQRLHIPTRRKPATAIKLQPRARAGFRDSQRQCAPAFRARGGAGKSRLQICNVFAPGGPRLRQHAGLDGQNNVVHLLTREEHIALTLDVGHIAVRHHVGRHGRLEFRLAPEHHDRENLLLLNTQEFLQRLHMQVVLVQRILELKLLAARQGLRPLRTLLIAENPAGHDLGFDHENAEARNDDVVDLRCSTLAVG